jgi:hypothetical protein
MFQFLGRNGQADDLIAAIARIADGTTVKLDPIEDPILESAHLLGKFRGTKADAYRISNRLEQLKRNSRRRTDGTIASQTSAFKGACHQRSIC